MLATRSRAAARSARREVFARSLPSLAGQARVFFYCALGIAHIAGEPEPPLGTRLDMRATILDALAERAADRPSSAMMRRPYVADRLPLPLDSMRRASRRAALSYRAAASMWALATAISAAAKCAPVATATLCVEWPARPLSGGKTQGVKQRGKLGRGREGRNATLHAIACIQRGGPARGA